MFKLKSELSNNLAEILSNVAFRNTLESLDWQHAESKTHAWEFLKLKQLEDYSIFLAIIIRSLTKTLKLGDYVYTRRGFDLLERRSPLIKKQNKENTLFKITKEIKKIVKPIETGRSVVID